MTIDQLTEARPIILSNAKSLLDDALLLLNAGRYARSYALSVLAREETGKLAMVVRAAYALNDGRAVDWNRFYRRVMTHNNKLRFAAMLRYMNSMDHSATKDPKKALLKAVESPDFQKTLDLGKQDGFYVGLSVTGIVDPTAAISESAARSLYRDTLSLFTFFKLGEKTDPSKSSLGGIADLYGKFICLADDLVGVPNTVTLPR